MLQPDLALLCYITGEIRHGGVHRRRARWAQLAHMAPGPSASSSLLKHAVAKKSHLLAHSAVGLRGAQLATTDASTAHSRALSAHRSPIKLSERSLSTRSLRQPLPPPPPPPPPSTPAAERPSPLPRAWECLAACRPCSLPLQLVQPSSGLRFGEEQAWTLTSCPT